MPPFPLQQSVAFDHLHLFMSFHTAKKNHTSPFKYKGCFTTDCTCFDSASISLHCLIASLNISVWDSASGCSDAMVSLFSSNHNWKGDIDLFTERILSKPFSLPLCKSKTAQLKLEVWSLRHNKVKPVVLIIFWFSYISSHKNIKLTKFLKLCWL